MTPRTRELAAGLVFALVVLLALAVGMRYCGKRLAAFMHSGIAQGEAVE